EFGGSIANIGAIDWSDAFAARTPPQANEPATDAGGDTPHGSRPAPSGGVQIAWNSSEAGVIGGKQSSTASADWLDDFLNHLGKNETQRNPNAAIRVQPNG